MGQGQGACGEEVCLPMKAVLEAIQSDNKDGSEEGETVLGREQFLKLTADIPEGMLNADVHSRLTHVILVADRSGSMSGNPIKQVESAVLYILEQSFSQDNLQVDVVVYDGMATVLHYTEEDYKAVVTRELKRSGSTNFTDAFKVTVKQLRNAIKGQPVAKTVIMFLTDGEDTSCRNKKDLDRALGEFATDIKRLNHPATVHSVGFSRSHDYQFLCSLGRAGNKDGMFRYCEPSDGPDALKAKLMELYDFVASCNGKEVDIHIQLDRENKIVGKDVLVDSSVIKGEVVAMETPADEGAAAIQATKTTATHQLHAETWVYLQDATILPKLRVTVILDQQSGRAKGQQRVECQITQCEQFLITDRIDKMMWSIRILNRNTELLTTKFAETIQAKRDLNKLKKRLDRLQTRSSNTQVYGPSIDKHMRRTLLEHIKEIQAKLDKMHSMMAEYQRGEGNSVSFMARVNDLRYDAQFGKSRRQRLMDMRVTKNAQFVTKLQSQLQELQLDKQQLELISADAQEFFFCSLSHSSVKELLLDTEDKCDCIGFGLAVKRPEHVLDEPTAIRVCVISGTLVSRSSMMDAWEYKISVGGHLKTHGGFEFDRDGPVAAATVGMSREPINAWLPLYVCKPHWDRVKTLLKQSLGYFCTLDPLGYDYKQMDCLFQVLGCMIGQLRPGAMGEHKLKLLFAFHRTCAAVCEEFELEKQMTEFVTNFLESPQGRTKDIVPNLYTLIGYLVCLPKSVTAGILADKGKRKMLWLAVTAECVRRAAGHACKEHDMADNAVNGVIDLLLHGTDTAEPCVDGATGRRTLFKACQVACKGSDPTPWKPPTFDPVAHIEPPKPKLVHSIKMDKAMDLWAQAKCQVIQNKNRSEQVAQAKKRVKQWVQEGKDAVMDAADTAADCTGTAAAAAGTAAAGTADPITPLDPSKVTLSMLDSVVEVLSQLSEGLYPNLAAVGSSMGFLDFWLDHNPQWQDIDQRSGLVPDVWIAGVRDAVNRVYSCMPVIPEDEDEADSNMLVTMTTAPATMATSHAGSDEDDELYSEYDTGDEDDYTHVKRRRRRLGGPWVSLVQLLVAVDKDLDVVMHTRAVLCQALLYHTNSRARTAAASGKVRQLEKGGDVAVSCLTEMHTMLAEMTKTQLEHLYQQVQWQRANYCMVHATTPWAFTGYLMATYTDRGEGIHDLIYLLTEPAVSATIPCLADKVRIILTGKLGEEPVLAAGNLWLPERKFTKRLCSTLGEEVWSEIEIELRSSVAIHVYRESDLPNRHGHCNSNPYIPNELRAKLGMPLLEVHTPARRAPRLRTALTK